MKPMRTSSGVTLVELLVAMAVLGILIAVAAPSLADFINQRRTLAVAEQLATDMAFARSEAGLRLQQVLMDFRADADSSCYTLHYAFEDSDCNCLRGVGTACMSVAGHPLPEVELRTVSVPAAHGVAIAPEPGSWPSGEAAERVAFVAPQMAAYPPSGRIAITGNRGLKLQLRFNASGRASLCAPDGTRYGVPACAP
jgi:prepilin-type N-terminal cleavage/methylation domain-containing protein